MGELDKILRDGVLDAKKALEVFGSCVQSALPVLDKASKGIECKDEARTVLIMIYHQMEKLL